MNKYNFQFSIVSFEDMFLFVLYAKEIYKHLHLLLEYFCRKLDSINKQLICLDSDGIFTYCILCAVQ